MTRLSPFWTTMTVLSALLAAISPWTGRTVAAAEPAAKPPNIVLIFIDDMGYGDIGPFGNTKVRTPHLDQMAKEGMKFTSFYATPVCSMSRACLMTGCYNARVSIPGVLFPGSAIGLHSDEITLAEIAKAKAIRHHLHWQVAPRPSRAVLADQAGLRFVFRHPVQQ